MTRAIQFLAIVLTALALVPVAAHLFAVPNKIDLAQTQYFVVQNIYRGWWLFGLAPFGALATNLLLTILMRHQRGPFRLALAGFLCIAATLAIYFTWTEPANKATNSWTVVPDNWIALRAQWEYSHAVNAIITFIGLCAVTLSALTARD